MVQTPLIEGLTFVGGHTVIFSVGGSRIGDTLTNTAPNANNRPGFDGGSGYLVSTSSPVPVS